MRASYAQSTCFDITQFPPAQMHLLTKNASCHLHFYSADHYELWFHLSDCRQKYEHQLYWISKGYSQDGQIFKCHGHFSDNHDQLWVGHFTRKSSRLVIVDWHAIKVRVEMSHLVPSSTRFIDVVTLPLILSQQCTSMIIVNVSVTQTCPSVPPPPPPRMLGHDWRPWSDCHSSLTVMDLPVLWIVYRVYWWWQRSTAFVYGQRHIAKFAYQSPPPPPPACWVMIGDHDQIAIAAWPWWICPSCESSIGFTGGGSAALHLFMDRGTLPSLQLCHESRTPEGQAVANPQFALIWICEFCLMIDCHWSWNWK